MKLEKLTDSQLIELREKLDKIRGLLFDATLIGADPEEGIEFEDEGPDFVDALNEIIEKVDDIDGKASLSFTKRHDMAHFRAGDHAEENGDE